MGEYKQDTRFGDSTEKAYSYQFDLYDNLGNLQISSGEQLHDVTQDTFSDRSNDIWKIYQDLPIGEIYRLRYTVTTLNGLTISTVDYRVMKAVSVDPEYEIKIHADTNYDEGFIDITLGGKTVEKSSDFKYTLVDSKALYDETLIYYRLNENDEYIEYIPTNYTEWQGYNNDGKLYLQERSSIVGEVACTGNFLITRASSLDNYFEWIEIVRFTMSSDYPSKYHFFDYTVEQGIQYKYAIQQFNIYDIYSNKVYQTDSQGNFNTTIADFEDMFLSDGVRQLKVRFNPKVTSFKNTIPEQKIETIGSKYPFIFRNGQVCYKEFPIGGLISFQMDNALLFLNDKELKQSGILDYDYFRIRTGIDNYRHVDSYEQKKLQKITVPIYSPTGQRIGEKQMLVERRVTTDKDKSSANENINNGLITGFATSDDPSIMRLDRNLTSENIMSERYFKLKVLDWLTDGKVKLFRSPTEGNYLVRLLNVQLTPQDPLGRMLHQFTCTAYEVDELNYSNLISFGIVMPTTETNYESQWASVDINTILNNAEIKDSDGFIKISPKEISMESITIQDFAPGDQIKLVYDSGPNGIFSIGVTGSLELNNDDRTIVEVWVKPNPDTSPYDDFSRTFYYQTTNIQLTKFDAITDIKTYTQVAEQFIGPINNLLEPYNLRDNVYGQMNEDGVVLNPLDELEAFHNVYDDLRAHQRFTYMLNSTTEKFTGLKLDILHVHRKEIIPIYCCLDSDILFNNSNFNWTTDCLFNVTPFGIPYVNSTNIQDFIDKKDNTTMYVDQVITQDENHQFIRNGVHIEDMTATFDENGVVYNLYDLLEPFYYDKNEKTWIPFRERCFSLIDYNYSYSTTSKYYNKLGQTYSFFDVEAYLNNETAEVRELLRKAQVKLEQLQSDEEATLIEITQAEQAVLTAQQRVTQVREAAWIELCSNNNLYIYNNQSIPGYYDLFRKSWMSGNEMYDPTFSINEPDVFPETDKLGYPIDTPDFVGDNNISLRETGEMTLYNLGEVNHIRLGNGVVAEITMQIRVVDYEIEKTDPETSRTKDEYLNSKNLLNKLLDMAMLHTSELAAAENEAQDLIEKMNKVRDQIALYGESSTATTGVMAVAEKRLIAQKKKLWYTLEKQIEDILDILSQQDIYLSIDGTTEDLAKALKQYIYDNVNAEIQDFDEMTISNDNTLYLYENPNTEVSAIVNKFEEVYNIIDDAYIFYQAQFENIQKAQQEIIDKCNTQLDNFAVQRGTIVGGYLDDYDEENPPPENTLVYTQYQLALIDEQLEQAYNRVVEIKSELVSKLLQQILKNQSGDLTRFTDTYIVDNADELIILLDSYIQTKEAELDKLAERFYQKATKLIFQLYGDLTEDILRQPLENEEDFLSHDYNSGYGYELDDVKSMFEGKLLNISRTMIGSLEIDPDTVTNEDEIPEETFENTTGVKKLLICLKALLTTEKKKAVKKQNTKAINALQTWIEYLITNKDSYIYEVPQYYPIKINDNIATQQAYLRILQGALINANIPATFNNEYLCTNYNELYILYSETEADEEKLNQLINYQNFYIKLQQSLLASNNIYTTVYTLEHNISDAQNELSITNEDIENLKPIIDEYLKKVTKCTALYSNCDTKAKVRNAYNEALAAYQNAYQENQSSYIFRVIPGAAHQYNLELHNILKEYYEEPEITTDEDGFPEFTSPAPSYNTQLLTHINKDRAIIDAYQAAYNLYVTELNAQIATLTSQKLILEGISNNPGYLERVYDGITIANNEQIEQEFITHVNEIRDNYITETTDKINPGLNQINQNIFSFLNLDENATANEKVSALLQLLIDEYNKNSANSVQNYLRQYLPSTEVEEEDNTNDQILQIISSIQNADATYQLKVKTLKNDRDVYEAEQNKYNSQIEELEITVNAIQETKQAAQDQYDYATAQLSRASQLSTIRESPALIEYIASNSIHQSNVSLVQQYLNWIAQSQENLIKQIGQVFSDVDNGAKYAEMLLEYINAYEVEAFKFLHYYDALEIDLHEGFYGNDGIDWLYFKPNEYWLSSYKDIFFLKEKPLSAAEISMLTNGNDDTTRINEYETLKANLSQRLLNSQLADDSSYISLSILVDASEISPFDETQHLKKYRIVKLQREGDVDKYYPEAYELSDTNYEHPLQLNGEIYLIKDNINYTTKDCELRPVVADEENGFMKDFRVAGYYTFESTLTNLIPAFDKDLSEITDEEFAEAAAAAQAARRPLKWLTVCPPVKVDIQLHNNLFENFNYMTTPQTVNNPEEIIDVIDIAPPFQITPEYYTYFDNTLGLIVHDNRNSQEYGSWTALKELDQNMWTIIGTYFTLFAYYENLAYSGATNNLANYYKIMNALQEAKDELAYYTNVQLECEVVLANYDAQGASSSSAEKQQLIMLLEAAREEVVYWSELVDRYQAALDNIMLQDKNFREFTIYSQMIPDIYNNLNNIIADFGFHYAIYAEKVTHYLKLLFNNQPHGQRINRRVLQNEELLHIHGNNTDMYNFGIAYALDAYKRNRNVETPISFSDITEVTNIIDDVLNNDYQFLFPIAEDEEYDNADRKKTYFYKDNGKYIQYRYTDDGQWLIDREQLNLYYTYYPSLIDFADYVKYAQVFTDVENYDPSIQYYEKQGDEYIPILVTPETWATSGSLYIKKGNGGLNAFLANLKNGSPYMQEIKDNYNGTLDLYYALLSQSLGDTTTLNNLRNILAQYELRYQELEDILRYKEADSINTDKLINDIYEKLAWYLVTLTNAYINLVERSYGVV